MLSEVKLNHIYQGSALEVLKQMPDNFIDCVITSPPYYGLRSYNTTPQIWDNHNGCNHNFSQVHIRKQSGGTNGDVGNNCDDRIHFTTESSTCSLCGAWRGELGQESTFHLFIDHLVEIFMECARVIKPTGSMWINIADSYGGNNSVASNNGRAGFGNPREKVEMRGNGLYNKSLLGIPERLAIALTDKGLIRRQTVIWHKRNCLPSSAKDRFTTDFEYFYFFTKSPKYYFKQQFEPLKTESKKRAMRGRSGHDKYASGDHFPEGVKPNSMNNKKEHQGYDDMEEKIALGQTLLNPMGRNKRCVWTLSNKSYRGAHFAVFQEELIRTPIDACCPEKICVKCGQAVEYMYKCPIDFGKGETDTAYPDKTNGWDYKRSQAKWREAGFETPPVTFQGLKQCDCNAGFNPGIVLDPFMGSGTTAKIAMEQNKNFIGIELNPEYIKLAEKRIAHVQVRLF